MQHFSLPDVALLLGDLYHRTGLGLPLGEEHRAPADDLGCHLDVQAAVWDLWQVKLLPTEQNLGKAGGWLDFDFYEAVPVK